MTPYIVREESARQIAEWLQKRGGIAIWESVNLSNPGASWTTPAYNKDGTPTAKPTWEAASKPARIIRDPSEVVVSKDVELKRFHVAVRFGSQGMMLKVSDGGSRRIRREVVKAGDGAYHLFDYAEQSAIIMKPASQVPLGKWLEVQP